MSKKAHNPTGKTSTPARAVAPEVAGDVTAFIKGIYSDLAPEPGEDTSGANNATAVLTDAETAALNRIVSLMGEKERSRSSVLRVALRRLITDATNAGVFADAGDSEKA